MSDDHVDDSAGNETGYGDIEYKCPRCGSSEGLEVVVKVRAKLTVTPVEGGGVEVETSTDGVEDQSHEFDEESAACCTKCEWVGYVGELIDGYDDVEEDE